MEERNKLDRLNELKAKVYDMLAAKQQIETQMAKLNQLIAQEQQRLQKIEIDEAKAKALKVNIKDSKIKDTTVVVDSPGAKIVKEDK